MSPDHKFEVRGAEKSRVAVVGDGIPVGQWLSALRRAWMSGTRLEDLQTELIVPSVGPPRFFQVSRLFVEDEHQVTVGQLLERERRGRNEITYEIGLRWFVHDSIGQRLHRLRGSDRTIGVLPAQPTMVDGEVQILVFLPGGDGPGVRFHSVELDDSVYFDFLTAYEITPSPFNP